MEAVLSSVNILLKPGEWNEIENVSKDSNIQNTPELLSKGIVVYGTQDSIYLINHSKANVLIEKESAVACLKNVDNLSVGGSGNVVTLNEIKKEEKPKKPRAKAKPKAKKTIEEALVEPVLEEQKVEMEIVE